MKLTRLKQIIKESIKELQNNKTLLKEDVTCEIWTSPIFPVPCPPDGSEWGFAESRRHTDCSWTTHVGGCSTRPPRDGGDRAPSEFTMGENITACVPVNKECSSQAQCVDKDGNRCGDCINPGAPHHQEQGICTTGSYDKFAPRDNQMDRFKR